MLSWRLNHHPDILSLGTCNPERHAEQICSCGEGTAQCPFWSHVLKTLELEGDKPFDGYLPIMPQIAAFDGMNKAMNTMMALMANEISPKCWKMVYEPAERFYGIYDHFYSLCRKSNPYKVFVDAERSNIKFMTLASMGFPVRGVIHVTRDPRSYAAQWQRYYPETPVETSTMEWAAAHTRIRRLSQTFPNLRFHRVAYETLLARPHESMREITDFLGLNIAYPEELRIDPGKNHMVGVSSSDTEGGFEERAENWRESLHPEDQERVLKVAGPLFSEFGYKA